MILNPTILIVNCTLLFTTCSYRENKATEPITTRNAVCGCDEDSLTSSIIITHVTKQPGVTSDTAIVANCTDVVRMYLSDSSGKEFEKEEVQCISGNEKSYKISRNAHFHFYDPKSGDNPMPEHTARNYFFDLIKHCDSCVFRIDIDSASNITMIERKEYLESTHPHS